MASGRLVEDDGRIVDPLVDADRAAAGRADPRAAGGRSARCGRRDSRDEDADRRAVRGRRVRRCAHRLSILTGGPGTGKTWTMRALVDAVRADGRRVRLCAPTGKAARRLGEATGSEATTIHRLLEWSGEEGGFTRDESDPIPGADLLVVDEASMLSLRLADALFRAIGPRTHVLLVGDADQLPPVGAGRVLDDLHRVRRGAGRPADRDLPPGAPLADRPRRPRDQPRRAAADPAATPTTACATSSWSPATPAATCSPRRSRWPPSGCPPTYGLDPAADVQVLAPMHRGPAGIDALNTELRARLNPDGEPIAGTAAARRRPRRADGQQPRARADERRDRRARRPSTGERDRAILATDDGRRLTVPVDALATIRLAYCMSVHKAQGSSAPAIVVLLDAAHHVMLTRNLLYTAVTRAERVCVLVCHPRALPTALRAARPHAPHAARRAVRLRARPGARRGRPQAARRASAAGPGRGTGTASPGRGSSA